jgi:hypothetical protein
LAFWTLFCVSLSTATASATAEEKEEWQGCDSFLAPSTMGWGTFAGRSFRKGEIVEMAAGFIPMDEESPAAFNSILDDYVYGYYRLARGNVHRLYVVMLGMGMFYNHHPQPNLKYTTFGREPAPDVPNTCNSIGFMATRDIAVGEQLFSSYGGNDNDGGKDWFYQRRIEMLELEDNKISQEDLPEYKAQYCSKIYAGIGLPTWRDRILPILPEGLPFWIELSRLAPFDAGIGDAKAKVKISRGERIELTTGLVVSRKLMQGTALGAVVLSWNDLAQDHQTALRTLRENGQMILQYQGYDTEWNRIDRFESFEDLAILPVAGNVGLVRRVGDEAGNCRLVIHSEGSPGSVGVTLELIATEDIAVGEVLMLTLPPARSRIELQFLKRELQLTGRQHYEGLFSGPKDEL